MRARDIMTTPVTVVRPETPIKETAAVLAENGFTALPVVDAENRLIGIVTRCDIVRVVARDDHAITEDVRHRLELCGGGHRWQVEVHDGMVAIGDRFDDHKDAETDRHVATVLAEAVPGVVRATAFATPEEDDR